MINSQNHDRDIIDVTNLVSSLNLNIPQETFQHPPGYGPDELKLGRKYQTKLNLSPDEVTWLNKFDCYRNAFNSIEGCEIAIVKLYLLAVKMLNKRLKKEDSSLDAEIEKIRQKATETAPAQADYFYDGSYAEGAAVAEAYYTIYRKAEALVRDTWGHKRKISAAYNNYSALVTLQFNNRLEPLTDEIITYLQPTIGETDEQIELDLNAATTTRWKDRFNGITSSYTKALHADTVEALFKLGRQNLRNPTRENIYYEAARFIAPYDKPVSLKLYLHYIYHDLKSPKSDQKQLNKSIQKKLFADEAQLATFLTIVEELVKDMNLLKAESQIEKVYATKRRKIELDNEQIRMVTQAHSGTVETLNGYLQEEEEEVVITKPPETQSNSRLTPLQTEFLQLFPDDYLVAAAQVEAFALQKGMFKNQLLDGINDACYEILDDVLIEEDDDNYVINPDYYTQIFA